MSAKEDSFRLPSGQVAMQSRVGGLLSCTAPYIMHLGCSGVFRCLQARSHASEFTWISENPASLVGNSRRIHCIVRFQL